MADDMSPEQVAELQRKNCVFCRIIAGEMDSKKVFENDHFLAVLDIRPAAPGHVLLLPKEHVPILPLLSEERMAEAFVLAAKLSDAVQDAMLSQRTTAFIASGYAAGQQAPHLIIHIIPREKGDGLDALDLQRMDVAQADALALAPVFTQATQQALLHKGREDLTKQHHIHKKQPIIDTAIPVSTPAGPVLVDAKGTPGELHTKTAADSIDDTPARIVQGPPVERAGDHDIAPERAEEFATTNEALITALSANPDLRRLIIAQPDLVDEYVRKSPRLSKLFEGVNVRALSLMLQRQEAAAPTQKTRTAHEMSDEELFAFIDGNQGLRTWMVENPEELAARLPENPRLAQFFQGADVLTVARKYREHRGAR